MIDMASLTIFANFGFAALVAGVVLLRMEPRLERQERAIDRLSKSILLMLISSPDRTDSVKGQASALMREMEARGTEL